jgi:hypothetical protein
MFPIYYLITICSVIFFSLSDGLVSIDPNVCGRGASFFSYYTYLILAISSFLFELYIF